MKILAQGSTLLLAGLLAMNVIAPAFAAEITTKNGATALDAAALQTKIESITNKDTQKFLDTQVSFVVNGKLKGDDMTLGTNGDHAVVTVSPAISAWALATKGDVVKMALRQGGTPQQDKIVPGSYQPTRVWYPAAGLGK